MVVEFLSMAAGVAPAPTVNVGWTPAATMGLIQNLLIGTGGSVGLKVFASHLLQMRKIADARAQQVDQRGDAQNLALTARVTELEKALSDERRECDRQLAEMRGELRDMQTTIDGFVRQMVAFQTSEARAMPLSNHMTRAIDSLDQIKGKGE